MFAVILTLSTLLNKKYRIMFLDEITSALNAFNGFESSTGKGILEMLSLPNDFIEKLEQLKKYQNSTRQ